MAKKLTPAMLDLLQAMGRGARLHWMPWTRSYDAYFFRSDTGKPCTKQAEGLHARGLIENPDPAYNRLPYQLTEAGRELLRTPTGGGSHG